MRLKAQRPRAKRLLWLAAGGAGAKRYLEAIMGRTGKVRCWTLEVDASEIWAFFVHPEWTRMGIATKILETCEEVAMVEGFRRFEMGATLTGVPMYLARGYAEIERIGVPLAGGLHCRWLGWGIAWQRNSVEDKSEEGMRFD